VQSLVVRVVVVGVGVELRGRGRLVVWVVGVGRVRGQGALLHGVDRGLESRALAGGRHGFQHAGRVFEVGSRVEAVHLVHCQPPLVGLSSPTLAALDVAVGLRGGGGGAVAVVAAQGVGARAALRGAQRRRPHSRTVSGGGVQGS
jgi:hypothetical protein